MEAPFKLLIEPPRQAGWLAHLAYALQGVAALFALLGPLAAGFLYVAGWPALIAALINHARFNRVRGTWLAAHFEWQIRTFWWALATSLVTLLLAINPGTVVLGIALALCTALWVLYRVVRGWVALLKGRALIF